MNAEINGMRVKEVSKPSFDTFRKIKPETRLTFRDAKAYWKEKLNNQDVGSEKNAGNTNHYFGNNLEVSSSKAEYADDNGKEYRDNDKLIPNNRFEVNGYSYKTDANGRLSSAEGRLRVEEGKPRNMEDVRNKEGQEYRDSDNRGHTIGHQFGGSDRLENLVPMDAKLNQGDFAKMENKLADAVKAGAKVDYKIDIKYEKDSARPSEFRVSYSINGDREVRVFKNTSGGTT